jgi:ankyrin repeat protein
MNRREVVRILLAHQANAQLRNNDGQTPLNLALESHHGAVATMLIQHGDR